ncbi:hypothetical protein ACFOW1_00450 [Parasediminibacterium paludis]|uniref:Uncharacterized protein n=1 Tax=Parasediminibacterium paludis TaxID=908966 RepID=A0ABV8PTG0_9BACT
MKKYGLILFFSSWLCHAFAQGFTIEIPKKTNAFTSTFLKVLNDAGDDFKHIKGKQINQRDTIHLASNTFKTSIAIAGSTYGRIVTDSTIYAEYYFGDYEQMQEAFAAYDLLEKNLSTAFENRSFLKDYHLDTNGTVVRLEKIAYCTNRGFYHFNIALQIIRLLHNGKFRILLQIYNGKPQFYYRIFKNEPVGSFNMVNILRSNLTALQTRDVTTCPLTIPPFKCLGKRVINDTIFISYQKPDFDDYFTVRTEFDVYLSNIRTSLGSDYVFYSVPCPSEGPVFKRWAFVQVKDLENYKRKTILLSLVASPEPMLTDYGYKKQYAIMLEFAY